MYNALAKHSGMSLTLKAKGDLWIDDHHTADKSQSPPHTPYPIYELSLFIYIFPCAHTGHGDCTRHRVQTGFGRSQGDTSIWYWLRTARRGKSCVRLFWPFLYITKIDPNASPILSMTRCTAHTGSFARSYRHLLTSVLRDRPGNQARKDR